MAKRPSKLVECMFCGNVPCTCNVKEKAAPKPRTPRKKAAPKTPPDVLPEPPSQPKKSATSIHDAMRAAAKKKAPLDPEIQAALDDPEMVSAIKAASILMGEEDLKKWKPVIDAEVEPQSPGSLWKARRNVVVE